MKIVILGAGATFGSSVANKTNKPPLLKDLPNIISSSHITQNKNSFGQDFVKSFQKIVELTGTSDDFETYLTVLYILGMISIKINPKSLFMNEQEIDVILKNSMLENIFKNTQYENIARIILRFFVENREVAFYHYPRNFQTFFQNNLREYIYHSLDNCYCIYHEKLFSTLNQNDAVVNFNYDEIGDFTLFSMNKLSNESFRDLPFDKIEFSKEISLNCEPIKYLKPHGSFSWSMDIDKPFVYYNLISEACGKQSIGSTSFPLIMPTIGKGLIYLQYPIYAKHIIEFSKILEKSDEILIVGKTFRNSDKELNRIITTQRKNVKCKLVIIDPSVNDNSFIDFHEKLFNGTCNQRYLSLEDYYNSKLY